MSTPNPSPGSPVHLHQHDHGTPPAGRSAGGQGAASLVLCALAVISAFPLLAVPVLGFLPALFAGAGILVAATALRGAAHGRGIAVTGLVLSVALFAILTGLATVWHLVVAGPAVTHPWFEDGLAEVWDRLFGS
ncbi:hypothetical protein [Brachybacterium hainanense]|uniref:DUF4190 domain-containing protein n=1 Tax=Brachybacterium hainanense TaxID=1541174 RepID=A0ABV6RD79_9MICO